MKKKIEFPPQSSQGGLTSLYVRCEVPVSYNLFSLTLTYVVLSKNKVIFGAIDFKLFEMPTLGVVLFYNSNKVSSLLYIYIPTIIIKPEIYIFVAV